MKENVKDVEEFSPQINIRRRNTVKSVEVTNIEKIENEDVYNMEVEDNHNFAVNGGLIVHNCMDDLRYFAYSVLRHKQNSGITRGFSKWG